MGTSDISGIGKVPLQGQTSGVKGSAKEENLQVAFTEVMSQMQACVGEGLMSGKQTMNVGVNSTPSSDYGQYGNCRMKVGESSGSDKVGREQLTNKLDQFADDVKEVLKDELGVSEEQLEEAMETLGLSYSDLLNPNQLAALVGELTGQENMSALLCSEEFMTIMQVVGELGENLLQELGVSVDELAQMIKDSQSIADADAGVDADASGLTSQEDNAVQESATQQVVESSQTPWRVENDEETTDVIKASEESLPEEKKVVADEQIASNEQESDSYGQDVLENSEESAESNADDGKKDGSLFGQQASENPVTQTRSDMTGSVNQSVVETTYAQTSENVNGATSQVDVSNIIKQIVEFSRVTLNNATTTMEMQLNPENLGKIYLALTSKGGVVSAHIATQNEAVKEALESQLVLFKQNMNQAGVKVDAVEVTVGSHEFERNLEQNAKQEQRQAEEQEKAAKQTRHINLNELDELNGIMTEEESLVAQMMADQGNSVDFTA